MFLNYERLVTGLFITKPEAIVSMEWRKHVFLSQGGKLCFLWWNIHNHVINTMPLTDDLSDFYFFFIFLILLFLRYYCKKFRFEWKYLSFPIFIIGLFQICSYFSSQASTTFLATFNNQTLFLAYRSKNRSSRVFLFKNNKCYQW